MQRVLTTALVALSVCAGASACAGKTEPEFGMADQQAIRQTSTALESSFNAKDVDIRRIWTFVDRKLARNSHSHRRPSRPRFRSLPSGSVSDWLRISDSTNLIKDAIGSGRGSAGVQRNNAVGFVLGSSRCMTVPRTRSAATLAGAMHTPKPAATSAAIVCHSCASFSTRGTKPASRHIPTIWSCRFGAPDRGNSTKGSFAHRARGTAPRRAR